jgi:hypothetical protein
MPHGLSKLLLYVLAGPASVGIAASFGSNMGVCISEGRLLRDEDYFNSAVNVVIHDPVDGAVEYVPGASISKLVHSQRYSGVNEFLGEFPECCKFVAANSGDGGPEIGIWDRIRGVRTVELSYRKRYAADDGAQKSARVTAKVAVTSCGIGRAYR